MKNAFYQVIYWTPEIGISGNIVNTIHETRVAADDEIDAECIVADRHPDGYGFWAVASKDVPNNPHLPHSVTWSGSY